MTTGMFTGEAAPDEFGRYCLLCIHDGDVVCVDYTDDLVLAMAWESQSMTEWRWFEDTRFDASAAN